METTILGSTGITENGNYDNGLHMVKGLGSFKGGS